MSQDNDDDRTVLRPSGSVSSGAPTPMAPVTGVTGMPSAAVPPAPSSVSSSKDYHNALPLGMYLGEFEIQGVIGEGGFGIVYLAWDHSLERRVALKEYMPSALAARGEGHTVAVKSERHRETFQAGLSSFVNEARLLAQFDHASLVKVYRFWEANGTAYMVMPFYEGVTLKDQLKAMGGQPDEAWLLGILGPLTEALEVIHAEQCYHRDIAPDNVILLKGSQRPLLLDFGAARRVIGDMTQALTVILKPGYAPVEQYAEVPGMKQGPWTDVYALAALVYNAITGKTPPTSVGRLMNDSYEPLSTVAQGRYSERFLTAIDKALVVKPEDRTPNIAALRADLGLDQMAPAANRTVMSGHAAASTSHTPHAAPGTHEAAKGHGAAALTSDGAAAPSGSRLGLYLGGGVAVLALLGAAAWWVVGGQSAASNAKAMQSASAPTLPSPAASQLATTAPGAANPAVEAPAATPAVVPAVAPSAATAALSKVPPPQLDGPFEPLNEFKRILAQADPAFTVEARTNRPQLRIGKDRLAFSVTSSRDGYVYVLLQSTDGAFMRLFPNNMGKNNRIKAGQTLNLPQPSWPMDTAGPAGTDHFLVIVSELPRDFRQAGMHLDGGFGDFPIGTQAQDILRRAPPGASPFAGHPQCPSGDVCPDVFGAAMFSSEEIQ